MVCVYIYIYIYISRNRLIFPEMVVYFKKRSYISRNGRIFPETVLYFQKQPYLARNGRIFSETVIYFQTLSYISRTINSNLYTSRFTDKTPDPDAFCRGRLAHLVYLRQPSTWPTKTSRIRLPPRIAPQPS